MFAPVFTLLKSSSALRGFLGEDPFRVFEDEAPQGVQTPYVVWTSIGNVPENTLSETPGHERAPIQLDLYCTTTAERTAIGNALRAQIETAAHITAIRGGREPETRHYRLSMDFDYWLARDE